MKQAHAALAREEALKNVLLQLLPYKAAGFYSGEKYKRLSLLGGCLCRKSVFCFFFF